MNDLSGKCCLVTGGAGFIGSTLVDQLLTAGVCEIRILDNFVRGSWANLSGTRTDARVKVTEGDIRDSSLVDHLAHGADYVFHQAALRITRCAEAPREATDVLIDGTMNVVEAVLKHNVRKLVAASSASVYGEPSYLPIDEGHPFNNRTLYGAGKIAAEQIYRALHDTHGLNYIALRPFNVYGPRMDTTGAYTEVLIRWLDALDRKQPPVIFGDGEQSMDFVYVGDVARAYVMAARSDISDDVFNVGTGTQTSLNELCDLVIQLTGSALQPERREARKVGNVQRRRAAVDKAEKMLGFRASVQLADGLMELIRWRNVIRQCEMTTAEAVK